MKKKIEVTILEERPFCNICETEIKDDSYMRRTQRIGIVRGLFKTDDFDAHEACLNKTIRMAFGKYFPPKK